MRVLAIVLLLVLGYTLGVRDVWPLMVEYIDQYTIKVNDLRDVLNKQFKTITIGKVKTSSAEIKDSAFSLLYKNGSTPTQYKSYDHSLTPTKVEVSNDSYSISFKFNITATQLLKTVTYSCSYTTDDIRINYTKEVDLVSGDTQISAFKSQFNQKFFQKDPVCSKTPTSKDKTRIKEAISNSQSSSIYLELSKILQTMQDKMKQNIRSQHLSQIYSSNPYQYNYYSLLVDVNVSTIATQQFGDSGIVNEVAGTLPGSAHLSSSLPEHQKGYNLYFAKQFVENMLDNTIDNYDPWKNINANRTNMRSRAFRFRLIDYQSIVPAVLMRYPDHYLADTQLKCRAVSFDNLILHDGNVTVDFTWLCEVSLGVSASQNYTFISFEVMINYQISIEARNQDYLTVYEKPKLIKKISFSIIDDNVVLSEYLVKVAIEECLFEFATYPVGTFFKVKSGSSKVKVTESGFWVG